MREAERSYRDAIKIMEEHPVLTKRTEFYNVAFRALATTLAKEGRLVEAEIEVRHALAATVRRYGRQAMFPADTTVLLGEILLEQGRYAEAETAGRTARPSSDPCARARRERAGS